MKPIGRAGTGAGAMYHRLSRRDLLRWTGTGGAALAGVALASGLAGNGGASAVVRRAHAAPRAGGGGGGGSGMTAHRITVGNVEILALSDFTGLAPVPLSLFFPGVPAEAWEPFRRRYPETFSGQQIFQNGGCYLVRSRGRALMVETGIGQAGRPMADFLHTDGRLMQEMAAAGVSPAEVDTVINTCLHPDHTGWNLLLDDGQLRLTFPNARYLVDEVEWEAIHRPEVEATVPFPFVEQMITPIATLGAVDFTNGDHTITSEVMIMHTGGHSPGNRVVLISSGGERAMIWGDQFIHPAQMTEPDWNMIFDLDFEAAPPMRRRLMDLLEADDISTVACHFPHPGVGKVVRLQGRRYWQAT